MGAVSRSALARGPGDSDFDRGFLLRVQAVEADPGGEGVQRFPPCFSGCIAGFPISGIKGFEFFVAGVCVGFGAGFFDFVSAGDPAGVGRDRESGRLLDPRGEAVVHHRGCELGVNNHSWFNWNRARCLWLRELTSIDFDFN